MNPLFLFIGGAAVLIFLGQRAGASVGCSTCGPTSQVPRLGNYPTNPPLPPQSDPTLAQTEKFLSVIPIAGTLLATAAGILLAAHTERLQDAQTENKRCAEIIPKWQADYTYIVQLLNAGRISPAQAIAGVRKLDHQTKTYLKGLVGRVGTAWNGKPTGCPGSDVSHATSVDGGQDIPSGGAHAHDCTRAVSVATGVHTAGCTVACCVYYSYLEPAMDCLIKRIAKGGRQAVGVPSIPGNKYNFPVFPGFTVQIIPAKVSA